MKIDLSSTLSDEIKKKSKDIKKTNKKEPSSVGLSLSQNNQECGHEGDLHARPNNFFFIKDE
jgi:hypothetical protein